MALNEKEGTQFELNDHDKKHVFMFFYEHVNSTRKFTIAAEIVSLLRKMYKRDAPFSCFVSTLSPRNEKNTRNLNLPPFWHLFVSMEMVATHSHARSIARTWLKHTHSFDRCGGQRSRSPSLTKRIAASGNEIVQHFVTGIHFNFTVIDWISFFSTQLQFSLLVWERLTCS